MLGSSSPKDPGEVTGSQDDFWWVSVTASGNKAKWGGAGSDGHQGLLCGFLPDYRSSIPTPGQILWTKGLLGAWDGVMVGAIRKDPVSHRQGLSTCGGAVKSTQ